MLKLLKSEGVTLACLALLCFQGCSTTAYEKVAEKCVDQFHQELNAQQFQHLYAMTDEAYRSNMSEEKSAEFFKALREKLGKVTRKELQSVNTDYSQLGITLTLVYATNFDSGLHKESFIWRIDNNQGRLIRYDIDTQ